MTGRRVLIVSPHFPPVNAPDHHRVRLALPELPRLGWRPTVLSAASEDVSAPIDPWLARTLPEGLDVRTVRAPRWPLPRPFRADSLGPRAFRPMLRAGNRLLSGGDYDLVYFSTTQFAVMKLGPIWRRRFGVPFVIDLQDPWVSDYYRDHPEARPPGGRLKYGLAQWSARRAEPGCVRQAAGVTSVSPAYVEALSRRYPDFDAGKCVVLPFGGAATDFDRLDDVEQRHFDPADGSEHWVSVGRGGRDLARSACGLFRAFAAGLRERPDRFGRVRMHFLGTDYAAGDRAKESLRPLAREFAVADHVSEHPRRLPYSVALRCLRDAGSLIVLGSDDGGYSPSKLYPYVLAKRPVLAILRAPGPAADLLAELGAGVVVTFGENTTEAELAASVAARWTEPWSRGELRAPIPAGLGRHSAETMARRLAAAFDAAAESGGRVPLTAGKA